MHETPDVEQEVENIILARFAHQPEEHDEQTADPQDGTAEHHVINVDLYRLEGGAVLLVPNNGTDLLETNTVESGAPTQEDQGTSPAEPPTMQPADEEQQEESAQEPEPALNRQEGGVRHVSLLPLVLLLLLLAGTASYWYLLPLTARAAVTITPKTRTLHTATTLTVAANPQAGQVRGRQLEMVSFTKSQSVAATGRGHDEATQAAGVITVYNADTSQSYTVAAGTSFTAQDVTVVTDTTVTVQAAVPPAFGTAITPAHVVQAGSAGNLAAHALYTRCCGSAFLTATNTTPFSGGQDERHYTYIQMSDIQSASSDLLASLTPQATAAVSKESHPGEQLVSPLCNPRITSSQPGGSEGASVTVSVTQQCTSVAYQTDSLNQVATNTLAQSANLTNYEQAGAVQVTVNGSTYTNHTALLKVSLSGLWLYHFTQAQLTQLTHQIAGKTQEQARATLESVEGVASVSIRLHRFDFKDQLPTNPQQIDMQFFYVVVA